MNAGNAVPLQERLLRLERALNLAISQERYSDAATLRDALAAARRTDPSLSARDALEDAVRRQDFVAAARLRDEIANLTELLSAKSKRDQLAKLRRQQHDRSDDEDTHSVAEEDNGRRVDRIVVLRARPDQPGRLRVATVSRDGSVEFSLEPPPEGSSSQGQPRIYLQPCFSPSGDFVCCTEISFRVVTTEGNAKVVSMSDSSHRVCVLNAFDGSLVKSIPVRKPPFFYYWSPCGTKISMLYSSTSSTSSLPSVSLSVVQVVAPAGGLSDNRMGSASGRDLDTISDPVISGHPVLYEFCPRDSNRIVAHIGDRSEIVLTRLRSRQSSLVLSSSAGSFGTPQWHPVAGENGRETVLFVESISERDRVVKEGPELISSKGIVRPQILRADELLSLRKVAREELDMTKEDESEPVDNKSDSVEKGTVGSSEKGLVEKGLGGLLDTLAEKFSASNAQGIGKALETFFKNSARTFGLPIPDELEDTARPHSSQADTASNADTNADVDAGVTQENASEPTQGRASSGKEVLASAQWGANEKKTARLVMCDVNNPNLRRCICQCAGVVSFKLSPDGRTLALLVNNPDTGEESLTLYQGDFSPDSVEQDTSVDDSSPFKSDIVLSTPNSKVLAFFWSPDGRKLLFLSSLRKSAVGTAQWSTFDLDSNRVARYEHFMMSAMFAHSLGFFCAFSNAMTPWSPDSEAFCYAGRALTAEEKKAGEADDPSSQANAATLLTALMLQKKKAAESGKGIPFSACVQKVAHAEEDSSSRRGKLVIEPPSIVLDNVELAAWSQC